VSIPLDFHPAVRNEIAKAHDWYEQRRPGLGSDFMAEVRRAFSEITADPMRYGFANANVRECPLSRFPFVVYYRVLTDRIRILSVFHMSRNPSKWQGRA
jgi:toxin ParE1/3/4